MGNDTVHGGADDDHFVNGSYIVDTLWGEAGNDTLVGGSGVNVLNP